MDHGLSDPHGWMPTGYQAMVSLAVWIGIVVAHAAWRSVARPEPDAIRSSGPVR